MNLVFGGEAARPQGRLLVADEDESFLSNLLTGAFSRGPLARMLVIEKVGREEGRARIDRGDGSAFLIIPRGLQNAYLGNQPARLQLFTNPGQRILPKIVEETLSVAVDAGFYVQQVAGDQLRAFNAGQAPSDDMIARSSIAVNQLVTRLRKYLDPPLMQLETSVVEEKRETIGFAALFFPSMFFMALLFVAKALASEIWNERALGTLRRLSVTPAPLWAFLAGRLVFVGVVFSGVGLVALAAMRWLASVPVSNLPAAALWLVVNGAAFFLLLLVAALHASSQRAADVLGNLVIFPLLLLGGAFFPFEIMPDWMARIGRLTPNGWAVVRFKAILSGSASAGELGTALAGLSLIGALAFLLALRRLRRGFLF
jgi:ABC-type multidrug transport system permease subunit